MNAAQTAPLVTVGMPVYNGGLYLREAIDSILSQEITDLELIISDNASTDQTAEICRRAQLSDARVRYVRVEVNRGAAWNYNRVLELAQGRFFHWAAADDQFAPSYLARCLAALEADDTAVLAYASAHIIDGQGAHVGQWQPHRGYAAQRQPAQRFRDVLWNGSTCFEIFGLMRRANLDCTPGIEPFADSDRSLLTRLAMMGTFTHVELPLYVNREHSGDSMTKYPDRRERARWFDPTSSTTYPQWRLVRAFASSAWNISAAPQIQRFAALLALAGWMYRRRRKHLAYEILRNSPAPMDRLLDRAGGHSRPC